MTSPAPQVPWMKSARSQIGATAPPGRLTRFNWRVVKNASDRPSCDQKIESVPSVPSSGRASGTATARTHTRFSRPAINANCDPSGDNAKDVPDTWFQNPVPSGGETGKRSGEGGTDGLERAEPNMAKAIAKLAAVARIAAIAATRLVIERGATGAASVS